ncbi:hypothetical protein [Pedobacter sp. WC2423]|uniref:hypothetical protein n=1 Tax=Pedobacter sp. WC2423 TaxID=3234142 RepID=UPI00346527EC
MNWFKLNANGDPYVASNYIINNNPGCIGGETLCAIFANSDAHAKPIITGDIQNAITNALNGIITPDVTQLKYV